MATGYIPNGFKNAALQGMVDGATALKAMLLTSSHTVNVDTQEFIDDVSVNETSGTGYTAGGQALANVAVTTDSANDRAELTCDDVVWDATGGSLSGQTVVIFDDTGVPGTSRIWAQYDHESSVTATNANFTFDPSATDGAIAIG